jgi:hypothetical protein
MLPYPFRANEKSGMKPSVPSVRHLYTFCNSALSAPQDIQLLLELYFDPVKHLTVP